MRELNHRRRLLNRLNEERSIAVATEISPHDTMFEGDLEHYFSVGQSALCCIVLAMLAAGKSEAEKILDFGCGFGRVLRVLKRAFPNASLAASDLSQQALDFCSAAFGAAPFRSHENPAAVVLDRKFDLIWCGTLLTNLDASKFRGFLRLFESLLAPGGLLVFTTHGPFVAARIRTGEFHYGLEERGIPALVERYEADGFGYMDYSREVLARLGVSQYGISVSKPSWVCAQIEELTSLRLASYTERAWDNHQDAIACLKQ